MFPRAFHYHRAGSLKEAATLLAQLGPEAKLLAGGQSLVPLMKLRFASPPHLVDLNFVPGAAYVRQDGGGLRIGALTSHADIEDSHAAAVIPILHDCAAGIADVQIRNRAPLLRSFRRGKSCFAPRLSSLWPLCCCVCWSSPWATLTASPRGATTFNSAGRWDA